MGSIIVIAYHFLAYLCNCEKKDEIPEDEKILFSELQNICIECGKAYKDLCECINKKNK